MNFFWKYRSSVVNLLIKFLDYTLSRLSIILMTVLVLTVLFQVFMRYIAGSPVTFTEELSRFLLIWLGLLAASYAYRQRAHLALDLLILKLKDRQKVVLNIVIHSLIGLFSFTVLVFGGIQLVYLTYILDQYSSALEISMAIVYIAVPLSGVTMTLYAIDFILQELGLSESNKAGAIPDQTTDKKDINAGY